MSGSVIEIERAQLHASLATAADTDDPLAAYEHLISFTLKNPPAPSSASNLPGLDNLLSDAVAQFVNDSFYTRDLRLLKLVALQAQRAPSPRAQVDILAKCSRKGVGTAYALLWEEHAKALERDSRSGRALRA